MTKEEKLIVSAYTGVLMTNFGDLHKFIEEQLGRPVFTHELASEAVQQELQDKLKPKFLALCNDTQ